MVKIRPIEERDYPSLIELFQEFAHFEKTPEKMDNSVERMRKERELFKGFVAENDTNEVVAYVTYFFTYHTWSGKCLYMDDLYVSKSYRKQGVGGRLLKQVIEFAKNQECRDLRWQVSNWNTNAQEFYKSIGAEIDSVEWNCRLPLNS